MAGKITIRRIGSKLPTVCLLLIIFLCLSTLWLSIVGFPAVVLRYVEKMAAEQGAELRIGALRLYPARGLALKADDVSLTLPADDKAPLSATAEHLSLGINVSHLVLGHVRPSFFMIEQGKILLPVTEPEGRSLVLEMPNIAARFGRRDVVQLTSGLVRVQGIAVRVQGSCDMNMLSSGEEKKTEKSPELPKLLSDYQYIINKVYQYIENQHWTPEQLPTVDVRLAMHEDFRVSVRGSIPVFKMGQLHLRDAVIDLQHNKNEITLNSLSFKTDEPDASARLQGGYDIANRHLSFNMDSSCALIRMVRYMSEGPLRAYLSKFRHPDDEPPHVQIDGDICFEKDYTLKSAYVRGNLEQKELFVGHTKVDTLVVSFFYDNGNFNIDKLELKFPDGSLQGVAAAQEGVGQAQLVADLPVQKMLTLASELSEVKICLPEGLAIGERVKMMAHARLTAPAFKPGQTQWQGFVPSFQMLAAELKTGLLEYKGYSLQEPVFLLRLSNIEQGEDLIVDKVEQATLQMKAQAAQLGRGTAAELSLHAPEAKIVIDGAICGEDALPQEVKQVSATLAVEGAKRGGEQAMSLATTRVQVGLHDLLVEYAGEAPGLTISGAEAQLEANQLEVADTRAQHVSLALQNIPPRKAAHSIGDILITANVSARADRISHGDKALGDASLDVVLPEKSPGKLSLHFTAAEDAQVCSLSANPTRVGENRLVVDNIRGEFPRSVIALVPDLLAEQVSAIELPERVSVSGACSLALDPVEFCEGAFHIEVPELVRTPSRLAVFRGKRVPIGVQADVNMSAGGDREFSYHAVLQITHESGVFNGIADGSTTQVHVTGTNTIRPDVVDMLIDHEDAHDIIRDFRFPDHAKVLVSNIDACIGFADGLWVDSTCDVDLRNVEYLLSAIEDTPEGEERLRRDLGANPYTLVKHGTCQVAVKVRDACHAKDGSSLADECVISINNATLIYDNAPWLQRNNWKTGTLETQLNAHAIIIDVEHSFVELQNVQGTVYPSYSLGMFYSDLQHYLEDVILPMPVQVDTESCVFPIYDDCTRPMSGTIRIISPGEAGFRFIGTTIPLNDFSGFVYITDNYVQLDRMNAKSWEGVLDAVVKIDISGKRTSFDGYAKAQCMNLQKIAAAYGSKQSPALCSGDIRFYAASPDLKDIKAYGQLAVEDGDLMSLSLFRPVGDLISDLPKHFTKLEEEAATTTGKPAKKPGFFSRMFSSIFRGLGTMAGKTGDGMSRIASNVPGMNHLIAYDLQEAHTKFDILHGHLITRDMSAVGYNLDVSLNLDIDLDTLDLKGKLWPRISSLPTIILSPLTFLSDFMVDIFLYGKVNDIKWRIGLEKRKPNQPPSATTAPAKNTPPPRKKG